MGDRRWIHGVGVLGSVGLVLGACGAGPSGTTGPSMIRPAERADGRPAPAIGDAVPAMSHQPPEQDVDQDQPAIWPAPGGGFATPEQAAVDFVDAVLVSEGDPVLGEFRQGDARSGEIPVLFAGESGDLEPPLERGLLLLREIGPDDGWYVIAATSSGVTISSPAALQEVAADTVTVSGEGAGFEGTLVVSAFSPGDAIATLDVQIGAGGAFGDPEPFSVDLDLTGAAPGDVVVVLVRGDSGVGNDPSTFAAVPIVVSAAPAASLPPTR